MQKLLARTSLFAIIGALSLLATGCVSILSGEDVVTQRAPGVATLGATMCISDYDANHYGNATTPFPNCTRAGVQETDNGCHPGEPAPPNTFCVADGDDLSNPIKAQVLVAFRVPNGVTEPQSFQSDAQDTTFTLSQSYTNGLKALFTAVPGQRWVGYVSGFKNNLDPANDPGDRVFAMHAEFGLPSADDGGPFPGPLKYRIVAGLRSLNDISESGDPVMCDGSNHPTLCADSPTNTPPAFPADLSKPVSDFGVLAGSSGVAGQGHRATVTFPVKYTDGGGLGAKTLALSAATTLPGGSATPGATTLTVTPGSTKSMSVTVAVPEAAPLGEYTVTLTAANGTPATVRSNTAKLIVADQVAPAIRISTPPNGSTFTFGQSVAADFGCTDQTNASGVSNCSGPVPNGGLIDTGSLGQKLFTVNASDFAGNTASATSSYTVAPRAAPAISMPFGYARFKPKTALTFLQVKGIPSGSTLTVRCIGKRCPVKKRFRKVNAKKTVTLKRFVNKSYPGGTKLEARVTKTGSVTAIRQIIIRKNKRPKTAKLCLTPGASKARKC